MSELEQNPDDKQDESANPQRSLVVHLSGGDYTVEFSPEQWNRLKTIILPKPKVENDAAQVTADHIWSVLNIGDLILNSCAEAIAQHDCRKLKQTPEQHHMEEPHHWPLDGYDTSSGYLPVQYVVEAVCDYIATVFGRAFAGRDFDWATPTNNISATDVLSSTFLDFVQRNGLAKVTPPLDTPGEPNDQVD